MIAARPLPLLIINAAIFLVLGYAWYAEHRSREARLEACYAQCHYDYTKETLHPVAGTYDMCIAGCNVSD